MDMLSRQLGSWVAGSGVWRRDLEQRLEFVRLGLLDDNGTWCTA